MTKPHLARLMEASEAARAGAVDFTSLKKATLTLGIMCTIGPARLIGFIDRLRKEIPALELKLRDAPGGALVEEMMTGDIEVATYLEIAQGARVQYTGAGEDVHERITLTEFSTGASFNRLIRRPSAPVYWTGQFARQTCTGS